ncbi:uncharacterized protein DUF1080 [Maribacter vaceletii]|uniref:Uncharacterized protein DUF1080 n=1 Tax=Maribacter vaceletii TaxID=1206816 RepID=A0A495EFA4_9FLAO|nr:DUF1080 domain-containing protein [Maribacter vaceletii]RKR14567.1 uncharacterized protein DUF1080 [Maribacter vaceletii]
MKLCKNVLPILLLLISCNQEKKEKQNLDEVYEWEELIDKELTQWDTYLSYQHQVGYDGSVPKDKNGEEIMPIGINNKGYSVFTTLQEGEDTIIKNTGEYYGCLITKKEYKNYHFQLKYKWGNQKWAYRKDLLKDSGILYHSIGPMAVEYWRSWMLSQEFQIMEGHTGDFWSQANSAIDIRAYKPESVLDPSANKNQDFLPIGMGSPYKNYCLRSGDFEKKHDEWNTIDLICFEGKSLHVVNGEVVMILKNSRYIDENGKAIPLTKGKIQLQSEAAEVFFKDIKIREIDSLTQQQKELF